jgi:histidyl-tRNA synthetase
MKTAKGVNDIPPSRKILQNQVVDVIRRAFELYGFAPLETPLIERWETLSAKFAAGDDSDALREIFSLQDQGKRKLGLRFDLTVPLARYVAMNPNLKMPFKRYEMGPVFRDGPIKTGRTRQFWQCDADVVGNSSMLAEAELLAIFQEVFDKLDLPVVIKVNNRKLLNGILSQVGVKDKEGAIISIDKLEKIGVAGVCKELTCTSQQKDDIFSLIEPGISLSALKKKITDPEGLEGVKELEELFKYLRKLKVKFKFDVSLARGLAYYTGTVYEVFAKKGISCSIGSGGRYDDMIGSYLGGGRIVPAVGISFGLVPIMECLDNDDVSSTKIFLIPINVDCLGIAQQLRGMGVNTDVASKKGLSKNLQYASALGIPYVAIVGEDEVKKGKILLRNMKNGDEKLVVVEDIIKWLS